MTLPSDILSRAADESVRRVALHLIEESLDASTRLVADEEHDALGATLAPLSALALHLTLIGDRFGLLDEDEQADLERLIELGDAIRRSDEAYATVDALLRHESPATDGPLDELARDLRREREHEAPKLVERLRRDLLAWAPGVKASVVMLRVSLDGRHRGPAYGTVAAGAVRRVAAELIVALEDFASEVDLPTAERVHLAASAMRDVLGTTSGRPLSDPYGSLELTTCLDASREVTRGASVLALLHDTDRRSAPLHVDRAVELMLARLLETTTAERIEALRMRLDAIARSLESHSEIEVEYKYLLRGVPPRAEDGSREEMAQGYVPGERLHERLRRVSHAEGVRYIRTVKLGSGLARVEVEEETSRDVFDTMWPLTEGHRVVKDRFTVPDGALVWTIDVFRDRELVLAEVEVPAADVAPSPPAWLASYIVRDVTDDPAYVNLNLAC